MGIRYYKDDIATLDFFSGNLKYTSCVYRAWKDPYARLLKRKKSLYNRIEDALRHKWESFNIKMI